MSYRDPKQALSPSLEKLIEGIREFDQAVMERHWSAEWESSHLLELDQLRVELLALEARLIRLNHSTW